MAKIVILRVHLVERFNKLKIFLMKLKVLILMLLSLVFVNLSAQISDDFSDGDFFENPSWYGDASQFVVNAQKQLQLNAVEPGQAHLYLYNNYFGAELEWRFSIKLAFSPSSGNFARVFLVSDSTDFANENLDGYFLQFGESGNNDAIELFKQSGDSLVSICRGRISIANSFFYDIKVVKDSNDLWSIYVDTLRNGIYVKECSGYGEYLPHNHLVFGVFCQFTSGNRNKFYFDDFYFGPQLTDTVPPSIEGLAFDALAPNQLLVTFSEPVSEESALEQAHYCVLETESLPVLCEFEQSGQRVVRLYFADSFSERTMYHVVIHDVMDFYENLSEDTVFDFSYCLPRWNEILISELMPDPSPPLQLPETEYIELYNTLPFPLQLSGWKLKIGNNERALPELSFAPYGYVVLVAASGLELWNDFDGVYPISSMSLTDDGQQLVLFDNHENVIHQVAYSKMWHSNSLKRDGGWALEMIDAGNPCGCSDNWDSSVDERGGTPGQPNSIAASNPDESSPELVKVTVPDASHVRVHFSEPVAADSSLLSSLFILDYAIGVVSACRVAPEFCVVELALSEELQPRTVYSLTVGEGLCDCVGLPAEEGRSLHFGLPESAFPGDIIINEVLSNPFGDTDADFVELYNRSDKLVDLGNLWLGAGNSEFPDAVVACVPDGFQLFPQEFVAVCKNIGITEEQYVVRNPSALVENSFMPAFPNDAGTVHLLDATYTHIDRFCYDKSMHYALLTSTDGVSLERIHYEAATQEPSNWTSAAQSCGWATPGAENSQFSELAAASDELQVLPEIISPDGDGYNDFAEIYCHFAESENRITIDILDRQGQNVMRLADNQLCGFEERFRWDGLLADGRAVRNDIYVVCMQLWNASGKRKVIRRTVAVTRRE